MLLVEPGVCYVVATPIGHLGDCSGHACAVLSEVDVILAEDTRVTGHLLQHLGIEGSVHALHRHNEAHALTRWVEQLQQGKRVALVSDAGTPGIHDPGGALVSACHAAGIVVKTIAGPSALTAALSVSGLPVVPFIFVGFLGAEPSRRRSQLALLASERRTMVFYEAPHRILETLKDMKAVFGGDRLASLSKELTKRHEHTIRDSLSGVEQWLMAESARTRGEFVLIVSGAPEQLEMHSPSSEEALKVLLKELSVSKAAKVAHQLFGGERAEWYALAMRIKDLSQSR